MGFWSTFQVYWDINFEKEFSIPYLNWTRQSRNLKPYYVLSGTNTGYGFYGIKTATEKYFSVTYLDNNENVILKDRFHGFNSVNGISRYKGYASNLGNYISDTETLIDNNKTGDELFQKTVKLREDFIKKSFKWVGLRKAKSVKECSFFRVELVSIVPQNIWSGNEWKNKPNIYVLQSFTFPSK